MGTYLYIPRRRSSLLLLFLSIVTILMLCSNFRDYLASLQTEKHTIRELTDRDIDEFDVTEKTTNRRSMNQHRTQSSAIARPDVTILNRFTGGQNRQSRHNDFMSGGGLNFYNAMLKQRLSLNFYLNGLKNDPLSPQGKEKEACMFLVENSPNRMDVATGYDCLLRLQMKETTLNSGLNILRAIKYGSLSLETFYTQAAAINLLEAIMSGYDRKVILGKHTNIITQCCTGYRKDEEEFLEEILKLNIPGLRERVMARQSFIHIFGRSSFNEHETQINLELAIDEINYVRNGTKIKQKNILDIVLTLSEDYALAAATCLVSALVNSDLDSFYKFHVIMDPERLISKDSQRKLSSYTYIRDYSIDFIVFPLDIISNVVMEKIDRGRMFIAMYRLYLDKLFLDLDIVLYLDTDVIVKGNLNALKTIDMTNYIWAGAPAVMYRYKKPYCNGQLPYHYLNAGVLLVNLTNSRRISIHDRIVDYILFENKCCGHEQNIINVIFADHIHFLPHRWNAIVNEHTERFHFSSFIAHHIGGGKNWKGGKKELLEENFDKAPGFRQEWSRYRELTRW